MFAVDAHSQCAAVYTSRRLSTMSGSTRKCMRLHGSNVWVTFYTLPPHIYAEYCGRHAARFAPLDRPGDVEPLSRRG